MNNQYKERTIICATCGASVTKRMPIGRKYCSLKCSHAVQGKTRMTGKIVPCDHCGVPVYKQNVHLSYGNHFCCLAHANAYQGRNKDEYTCKICGKAFRWSPSRKLQQRAKALYCSIPCRNADPALRERLIQMNKIQQEGKPSSIEVIGYKLLDALGVEYLPQHLIGGKFCVDAFVPSLSIVIQFDGDYWHLTLQGSRNRTLGKRNECTSIKAKINICKRAAIASFGYGKPICIKT